MYQNQLEPSSVWYLASVETQSVFMTLSEFQILQLGAEALRLDINKLQQIGHMEGNQNQRR